MEFSKILVFFLSFSNRKAQFFSFTALGTCPRKIQFQGNFASFLKPWVKKEKKNNLTPNLTEANHKNPKISSLFLTFPRKKKKNLNT